MQIITYAVLWDAIGVPPIKMTLFAFTQHKHNLEQKLNKIKIY